MSGRTSSRCRRCWRGRSESKSHLQEPFSPIDKVDVAAAAAGEKIVVSARGLGPGPGEYGGERVGARADSAERGGGRMVQSVEKQSQVSRRGRAQCARVSELDESAGAVQERPIAGDVRGPVEGERPDRVKVSAEKEQKKVAHRLSLVPERKPLVGACKNTGGSAVTWLVAW